MTAQTLSLSSAGQPGRGSPLGGLRNKLLNGTTVTVARLQEQQGSMA